MVHASCDDFLNCQTPVLKLLTEFCAVDPGFQGEAKVDVGSTGVHNEHLSSVSANQKKRNQKKWFLHTQKMARGMIPPKPPI